MPKVITVQDCTDLYAQFMKYTETAEQHEFPRLAMVHMMLNRTIAHLNAVGTVENQKDARAMFRVVLKTIGKDASEYEEEEE
ncbi:MAG: hypothetical protein IKZ08_02450 [Bacteroidales bacterium]|nr:hypothetical protein [Bacteroidales bacterium]